LFTASWSRHVLGETLDLGALGFEQRLLGGRDVEHACSIGNMRDLRIGELGASAQARPVNNAMAAIAALSRTNMVDPPVAPRGSRRRVSVAQELDGKSAQRFP
jgi:hypothetical protein